MQCKPGHWSAVQRIIRIGFCRLPEPVLKSMTLLSSRITGAA